MPNRSTREVLERAQQFDTFSGSSSTKNIMPSVRKQSSQIAPLSAKNREPLSEDNLFEEKAIQVSSASRVRTINHNLPADSGKKKLFPAAQDENRIPSRTNAARKRSSLERSELERADFDVPAVIEEGRMERVEAIIDNNSIAPSQPTLPVPKMLPTATPLLSIVKAVASPKAAHRRTPLTAQEKNYSTPVNRTSKSAPKAAKPSPPVDILDDFQSLPQVKRKVSLDPQADGSLMESLQLTPAPVAPAQDEVESSSKPAQPPSRTPKAVIKRKTSLGAVRKSSLSQVSTETEPEVTEQSMEVESKPQTISEPPVEMKQTSIDTTPQKPPPNEPLVIRIPPPPPIETLSLFDTAVLTELKDVERPFISEADRLDIESFLDSFTSPDISKHLIPVSIIGEGTFSTVYKVIDLSYYDCDNSKWAPFSRQNQLDYLRLWRWFFAQKETVADELILFQNGKRTEFKKPAKTQTGTSLYTLIRNFFYDWAWRGLNALSKEISIDKLDPALLPALLQSKMYTFRPYFIALKRINATSSPQRILDEMSFLKELGGKDNVVPLISGFRNEDQIVVTFPYFYSEDFRVISKRKNVDIYMLFLPIFLSLATFRISYQIMQLSISKTLPIT